VKLPTGIRICAAISVLFACRLVVSLVLIPPWQQPDENAHVAIAEAFASRLRQNCFTMDRFAAGDNVGFRVSVIDGATGQPAAGADLVIRLTYPGGKTVDVPARYRGAGRGTQILNLWTAEWTVPTDVPAGIVGVGVTEMDESGRATEWAPFPNEASYLTVNRCQSSDPARGDVILRVYHGYAWERAEGNDWGREEEILQSMVDHGWWRHYGVPLPETLPPRFGMLLQENAHDTLGMDPTSLTHPKPYYAAIAVVLALGPPLSVVGDLYVMRALSAVFAMLTLWIAWRASREYLGELAGTTIVAMLALHPRFAVAATAANSDALVNLIGVVVWWQAMRAVRGANMGWSLVAMWVAAACGAMVDRMGAPLLIAACVMSIAVGFRTEMRRSTIRGIAASLALLVASLGVLAVGQNFRNVRWDQVLPVPQAQTWEYFVSFTSGFVESWWASFGWLRYPLPSWLATVALVLTAVAIVGVVRRFLWGDHVHTREIVGVSVAFIGVQVAALYWAYFRLAHGAEGRHLFPVLIPTLVLMWLGVAAWVPVRYRQYAAVGLVLMFAAIDSLVWALVGVPAYAR